MAALRIVNGHVVDPQNRVDGPAQVHVDGGRIVADPVPGARVIDARGCLVVPGGVDMHAHIAGPKVNLARKLQPEDHRRDPDPGSLDKRSGVGGVVPSTFTTGYRYATLGYTTVMEAAVPPLGARHALEELADTPVIDKGFYAVLGNNLFLFEQIAKGDHEAVRDGLAWWLANTHAYTAKLVNVGADELWKGERNRNIVDLDEAVPHFGVTPRQVTAALVRAVDELGLPHPAHVHCNNLGHSGNVATTLATMEAAEGHRIHLAHIQFHSYGGEPGRNPTSAAREIIDYVNTHPNVSCDVGQVMFGQATAMTADAPLAWMLRHVTGGRTKWVNADTECESGCGVMPFSYQEHNYVHTLQWAIGLELFLLSEDPWRVVLSTDHPNGGSFMSYPKLMRLLMDSAFRREEMKRVNRRAIARTLLPELEREYTLSEAVTVTRAAPARLLGLAEKGHLGPGADADIAIYERGDDWEQTFSAPRWLIKDGELVIEDHELKAPDTEGRVLHVRPGYDAAIEARLRAFFDANYSIRFDNYAVDERYLHRHREIASGTTAPAHGE